MERQVFHDPSGRRGRVVGLIGGALLLLALVSAALVVQGALVAPSFSAAAWSVIRGSKSSAPTDATQQGARILSAEYAVAQPLGPQAAATPRLAFVDPFAIESRAAFRRQQRHLDGVIVTGVTVSEGPNGARFEIDEDVSEFLEENQEALADRQLLLGADLDVAPNKLGAWAAAPGRSDEFERLAQRLAELGADGVVFKFSGADESARSSLAAGLRAIREAFARHDKLVLADPPYYWSEVGLGAIAQATDYTLVSLFRHVGSGEQPTPLADQAALTRRLKAAERWVGSQRMIPVIGSFAALWSEKRFGAEISIQAAWETIGDRTDGVKVSPDTLMPSFRPPRPPETETATEAGKTTDTLEEIHLLDATAAFNQARAALARSPAAIAVWRLGMEDPSLWRAVGRGRLPDAEAAEALRVIEPGDDALRRPPNSLFTTAPGRDGERSVAFNAHSGLIHDERLISPPSQFDLSSPKQALTGKVAALTFDDGPDPKYTPQILDILRERGVKATFYMIGQSAAAHPELVRRIYAEGHDIGNHSHSHPQLWKLSGFEIGVELNRMQRVLESTIGVTTRLMRPPYVGRGLDQFVTSPELTRRIGELGYLVGGIDASSHDWLTKMDAKSIVNSLMHQIEMGRLPAVLLHDGGGDRSDTVEALPMLIDRLEAAGYRMATTHEIYGLKREDVMPSIGEIGSFERAAAALRGGVFAFGQSFETSLPFFALIVTGFGVLRLTAIAAGAIAHRRRERRRPVAAPSTSRSVAVLVPAYNEEKVIAKTIESVLASVGVPNLRILVVDDGSKDGTWRVLQERYGDHPIVKPMTKPNGGKAAAVNYALEQAEAEIVICIDADTVLSPDAVARLASYFDDPEIGAVAGTVEVGNADNWVTRMQALEYITCQNLDRRAFALGNAVSVVPGAIGAWRREALVAVGGFPRNTLAEDADATLRLLLDGWRIESDAEARAYTEAPQTVRELMKQRRRWSFGTLQVAAKTLLQLFTRFRWRLAAFYMPNIAFLLAFTLLAPMVDGLLLYGVALSVGRLFQGGSVEFGADLLLILVFWVVFQIVDFAVAALGLSFEKDRRWLRLLPWVPLQRFGYRQILYVVTIGALFSALKGQFVGWGKLLRTGAVRASASLGSVAAPASAGDDARRGMTS